MPKRIMPATTKRFAPERCMTDYMNMLLVRVFNEYARIYGNEFVYRARSKTIALPLITDEMLLSNNALIKSTYWIPTMPRQLISSMLQFNTVLIRHMDTRGSSDDDDDLQGVPEPHNERLTRDDCAYPIQLIIHVNKNCTRDMIGEISDIIERVIKSIVEYVAIIMITVKHYPKITSAMCCMLIHMPDMIIDCAQSVEDEAKRKTEARAKSRKIAHEKTLQAAAANDDEEESTDIEGGIDAIAIDDDDGGAIDDGTDEEEDDDDSSLQQ